uniref:Uncharacterized protein n=1 Tax=Parascaris univalens TaxID=6257 RepID=A0A915BRL0_PARUN
MFPDKENAYYCRKLAGGRDRRHYWHGGYDSLRSQCCGTSSTLFAVRRTASLPRMFECVLDYVRQLKMLDFVVTGASGQG